MKCYIENKAWQKMQYYIQNIDAEISGLGKTYVKDGDIYVTDLTIFKQEVTGVNTDLSQDNRALFQNELKKKGEDVSKWNLWWHSHVNMNVFWSGTDDKAVENDMGKIPYLLSIVSNKKKEIKTRVDFTMNGSSELCPIWSHEKVDDVETEILPPIVSSEEFEKYNKIKDKIEKNKSKIDEAKKIIKDIELALEDDEEEMDDFIEKASRDDELEKLCIEEIEKKVNNKKDTKFTYRFNNNKTYQKDGRMTTEDYLDMLEEERDEAEFYDDLSIQRELDYNFPYRENERFYKYEDQTEAFNLWLRKTEYSRDEKQSNEDFKYKKDYINQLNYEPYGN